MLNSVSSATKAAPVSSLLSSPVSARPARSLASPMGRPLRTGSRTSRSPGKSVRTGGVLGAELFRDAHGGEIEEKDEQALVVVLDLARGGRRDGGFGVFGEFELVVEGEGRGGFAFHGEGLEFEHRDLLGFAVFEDGEVSGFEAFDGF